jgi:cytochrome P450
MSNLITKGEKAVHLHRSHRPPGPPALGMLGTMRALQRNPLRFLLELTRQYGDLVFLRFLAWPVYIVNHPADIKRVLQEHHSNYNKDTVDYRLLQPLLGKGLLTNDGASWLHQRRLIQPAFHRHHLATFGTLMTDVTLAMLEQWREEVATGQPLDVAAEMMRLTFRIVGQALFAIDLGAEGDTVRGAITTMNQTIVDSLYTPFSPIGILTTRKRLRAAYRALDQVVQTIIAEHRRQPQETGDVLSRLLLARDEETGQGMDDQQVRDEVITLLVAGHETTSNALCWTWYLLAQHPVIEQHLHAELDEVLGGRVPTVEDLPRLPYSRMVIEESMRLYPPAWSFSRNALAEDELGGYHVPTGSLILLCPYTTHRHPAFWEQPAVFDPLRFTPEHIASRPPYAYFPFGGGPRQCIGSAFALMEAQLILVTLAQRYRLCLGVQTCIEPEPLVTLRPRGGLPMLLQPLHGRD